MRTFIAIELEEETKAQLAEVQAEAEKLCRRGNYTPQENFHLTLHFLGEVQEEDLDYLHEAIYETARRNRPFTMTIDKIGFFPRGNKGILWAGIERSNHLQRLFSTLEKSLEQQGFARERKGLSPHITLGREVEPQRNFTDVQRGVRVESMRVSVRSISLMESVRRGARLMYVPYKTLYNRFVRWSRMGVFNKIFAELAKTTSTDGRLMIDATHLKAHRTAASLLKKGLFPAASGVQKEV